MSNHPVSKMSTLMELTMELKENKIKEAFIKKLCRNNFDLEPKLGVTQQCHIAHLLAVCFHVSGAGNRWDVTGNTTVKDVKDALPGPKQCKACGNFKQGWYMLSNKCLEVTKVEQV